MKMQRVLNKRKPYNNRWFLSTALMFLVLCLFSCKTKKTDLPPQLSFEKKLIDVGNIKQDSTDHTFDISYKNVGGGILKIDNVSTSCYCAKVDLPTKELEADEDATMKVILNVKEMALQEGFIREIYISSNSVNSPDTIALTGAIVK